MGGGGAGKGQFQEGCGDVTVVDPFVLPEPPALSPRLDLSEAVEVQAADRGSCCDLISCHGRALH